MDRESAFEMLAAKAKTAADQAAAKKAHDELDPGQPAGSGETTGWTLPGFGDKDDDRGRDQPRGRSGYQRETIIEAAMKSVTRTVATQVGRAIVRGILGSLKR